MIGPFRPKHHSAEEAEMLESLRKWGTGPVPVEPPPPFSPTLQVENLRAVIARERRARSSRESNVKIAKWLVAAVAVGGFLWSAEVISMRLSQNPPPARGSAPFMAPAEQQSSEALTAPPSAPQVEVRGNVLRATAKAAENSVSTRVSLGSTVEAGPLGAEVVAEATLAELSSGAQLILKDISPVQEVWFVQTGSVRFEVDPLRKKQVIVETVDSRFEVVGTAFTVVASHTAAGTDVTTLRVHHGRVRVATLGGASLGGQQLLVGPRGRWSSERGAAVPAKMARKSNAASESSGLTSSSSGTGAPSTTLAEENRIFAAGLRARNAGELREAARLFSELISRYPNSFLRRDAEREITRVRSRLE